MSGQVSGVSAPLWFALATVVWTLALIGVLGLALVSIAAFGWQGGRWLGVLGLASTAVALVALMAIEALFEWRGALQRTAEAAFLIWFVACGVWLRGRRRR